MTSEEVAATGISSTGEEIHESEDIRSRVDDSARDAVPDSGSCEEGEIGYGNKSGGEEDLTNIEADPSELVAMKNVKSYPPAYGFGESNVTTALIKNTRKLDFFLIGDARPPSSEQVLLLKQMKWLFSGISLLAVLDFHVILPCPLFLTSFQ
jgi:hypothetical protein